MGKGKGSPSVLFVNGHSLVGGVARVLQCLAHELDCRGWSAHVVIPQDERSARTVEWFRAGGVSAEASEAVREVEAHRGPGEMARLRQYLRLRRPDILNLHYGFCHIALKDVLAARLAGQRRLFVSLHGLADWTEFGERKRKATALGARLCRAVIVNSEVMRANLLEAGVPASRIRVIPCGLPVPPSVPSRAEARQRLGIPDDHFVIGAAARLEEAKGLFELVEAAARLRNGKPMHLLIAGEGKERARLEALAEERMPGSARFLGLLDNLDDFYAALDVFALPSHGESFGLVFVEAALRGVPSVGTRVGGIPCVVADGQTGLLVAPRCPEELATALGRLRDDPGLRERLGQTSRTRALAEFTAGAMTDQYEQVFRGQPENRYEL